MHNLFVIYYLILNVWSFCDLLYLFSFNNKNSEQ